MQPRAIKFSKPVSRTELFGAGILLFGNYLTESTVNRLMTFQFE